MNKCSSWLIALGTLLLAAALGLTAYNLGQSNAAAQTATQAAAILKEVIPEPETAPASPAAPLSPAPEEPPVPDYVLNPDMEMPVVTVESRDYIGLLSIPALGLELPVISDWDYPALRVAPCRYGGSAYQNNLVIAAHNYASHFGRLNQLSPGDEVQFRDTEGNLFSYQVADLEILEPYDLAQMTAGGYDLTLFTCTLGGSQRLTLRCSRVA